MTTPIHPDDDPLAARLSDALHTEADMVQPSDDGLQQIRSGIEASRRPWWRHPAAIAVAAAAVLGVAVGGTAVLLGDDESGTVAADRTTEPATTAASTPPGSTSTGPSTSPVPVEGDVYVYYVMDDGQAPRLYREQHPNPGAAPVVAALSVMFGGSPDDPDYSSPWPEGTEVLGVDVAGDTATVDMSDFVSVGAEAETIAVQQVVYTVTANDNAVQQVRLLVDGKAPQSGHSDWSDPVSREPMVDVQGFIWLLTPTEGATVSSPVEITGFGTAFEGTVSWEVRRDGSDEVLAEGFTQAGANGEFDEFTDTVDLDPGVYEIRAFESSAEDGRPLHVDTKVFTVE